MLADISPRLYLASRSVRRQELLRGIGVRFDLLAVAVEEIPRAGETARAFVARMAREKACAGLEALRPAGPPGSAAVVLGADTVVVVDGVILGKPAGREDALGQLARLSGRDHHVLTAVALARAGAGGRPRVEARLSRSRVWFRVLGAAERAAYWDTGEPADKAGSYAVQGLAARFVRRLDGSWSGVVGLPLYETSELLARAGLGPRPEGGLTRGDRGAG